MMKLRTPRHARLLLAAGAALLALSAGQARAAFTVTLDPGNPTGPVGGVFTYAYSATTALDERQRGRGDFRICHARGVAFRHQKPGAIIRSRDISRRLSAFSFVTRRLRFPAPPPRLASGFPGRGAFRAVVDHRQ